MYGFAAYPLALALHAGRQYGVLAPANGAAGVSNEEQQVQKELHLK